MQLQYGRNSNTRSNCWKRTSQDGTRKDQGSQGMENANESQRHRKFPRICKLLQRIYSKLQLYSKTIKQVEREKGMTWNKEHQKAFEELKEKITS